MKELRISKDLALPLEWMTLATVVYGARGSGKTCLGRVLAEETHRAGQRFCAIDLKGDWWGLKASADGKSDGIPVVVFGGDHADLPLEENAGAEVARLVAELEQSTILDFEHLSKGKQLRFQAQFFATLYDVNRNPLVLLGDEAQRYATQKPIDPEAAKCLGAVEDLIKLGRKHGIAPVLFTQRGSGLNKEVSELCDLLVCFRTPGPLDQRRVEDWLDANVTENQALEVMSKIAGLATGTAVFASGHPDLKLFGVHKVRMPTTFDSSATPKIGERRKEPTKLAKPDLDAIRAKMTAAIERAKADDPKALRARIAELEKAAQVGQRDAQPEKVVERVEVPVFDESAFRSLEEFAAERLNEAGTAATHAYNIVTQAKTDIARRLSAYLAQSRASAKAKPSTSTATIPGRPGHAPYNVQRPTAPKPSGRVTLDRRILTVLAQHRGKPMTYERLALHLGIHPNTKSFRNMLSSLRTDSFVDGLEITEAGIAALGTFHALPLGAELFDWWLEEKLAPAEGNVLRAVAERDDWTYDTLAEHLGIHPNTKSFRNTLSKFRGLGIVDGLVLSAELR